MNMMAQQAEIQPSTVDFSLLKQKQQATWASGDYAVIGLRLQIVGETLAEAANLRAGERIIDIAAGNGNATLAAARRFANVTSTDYVPELLKKGQERARVEGYDVRFEVADAESLPYRDGTFDVAMSIFGVMFTPHQTQAAKEMIRVVRRGGRIALASWTQEGFLGELFRLIGKYAPPPAGVLSPMLWGNEHRINELFGNAATSMHCQRRMFNFHFRSAAHWIEVFRNYYGPIHKLFSTLDAARQSELNTEMAQLLMKHNVGGPQALVVPSEYLETVINLK